MNRICVALDLETTGLDPQQDEIIEIGAVKFQGARILDVLHSLVRPRHALPYRIQQLTGISSHELSQAPFFELVAGELAAFLGSHPLVGHNLAFDMSFLRERGMSFPNPTLDTLELSRILVPSTQEHSLRALSSVLGISTLPNHRALPDATAAQEVFLILWERALALDRDLLEAVSSTASMGQGSLAFFFTEALMEKGARFSTGSGQASPSGEPLSGAWRTASVDLTTFLAGKAASQEPLRPSKKRPPLDVGALTTLLEEEGPLARYFPGYEHRPQQVQMMQEVAQAMNEGELLLVEASTGTGKSVAYLLPAIFFAYQNGTPVVISTHTINLQEQLAGKDIPDLLKALASASSTGMADSGGKAQGYLDDPSSLKVTTLKGRSNYLCLRRLASLTNLPSSSDEPGFLAEVLVWLNSTQTGDRAELNVNSSQARLWNRVSAQADDCLSSQCSYLKNGLCFLQRARQRAASSHVVVANHALLISDILTGSKILPEHQHLIIDEAHHLEDVATDQLGFHVTQWDFLDTLSRLSPQVDGRTSQGFLAGFRNHFRIGPQALSSQGYLIQQAEALQRGVATARTRLSEFFQLASPALVGLHPSGRNGGEYGRRLRLTKDIRRGHSWIKLEELWGNTALALADVETGLARLYTAVEDGGEAHFLDYDDLMAELSSHISDLGGLRRKVNSVVTQPEEGWVYWMTADSEGGSPTLCAAPLQVGEILDKTLFSRKDCVILTSATLTTEETFHYIKGRLGLKEAKELILTSPFDFLSSTLVFIPQDIPEPDRPDHQKWVERALVELPRAAQGRTLALFTSHASLQAIQGTLAGPLEEEGIMVMAQGVHGLPNQLLASFRARPRSVLLGTSSFWEGVDVVGEALSLLVITRLPFSVPTEPVFAARSELFADPFNEYALPQAILRFRQGFGRLIRSKTDRGVVVILDRRVQSRGYGTAFLSSLPPCTIIREPLRKAPDAIRGWLGN